MSAAAKRELTVAQSAPSMTEMTDATVVPAIKAHVRWLRGEAALIGENIADMVSTQVRIGERDGWDDPRIDAIECDITIAQATRERLILRANELSARVAW